MRNDTNFAKSLMTNSKLRHKYLRIRYEDFVSHPLNSTQAIYDFAGLNFDSKIGNWLKTQTSEKNPDFLEKAAPFGLKRNSKTTISAWREHANFEKIQEMQNICSEVLETLGYRTFNSSAELSDLSNPAFTLSGFDDQERNLSFVKTAFQV